MSKTRSISEIKRVPNNIKAPVSLIPSTPGPLTSAGVKGNFRHSHVNNMSCRLCSQDSDETQEHLQLCEGTRFERRGLDLTDWRGLLDFWRRMKIKMAAVT